MVWTIYCHTHIESGRKYVGMTSRTWQRRWSQHIIQARLKKNGISHFPNAIRKYGKDAFSHEVLEKCETLEEANPAEHKWIEFLGTRDQKRGFNIARGGGGPPTVGRLNPWDDPGFRSRVTASVTKAWKDPDLHERMSEISREVNSRSDVKAKIGKAARTSPKKSSRFFGVSLFKRTGRWIAYVLDEGTQIHLGCHVLEEDAARAHDKEAVKRFGEKAILNFPDTASPA